MVVPFPFIPFCLFRFILDYINAHWFVVLESCDAVGSNAISGQKSNLLAAGKRVRAKKKIKQETTTYQVGTGITNNANKNKT